MTLRQFASILLMGSALIACAVVAQEEQHNPSESRQFRIYRIYLAGPAGKPLSIKASAERIESMDGTKIVSKHWVEEWLRDEEGRVWGRVRAPQEENPGKLPPLATVWLFDPAVRKQTLCSVADRNCQVYDYNPPYPISFLRLGGSSIVGITPEPRFPSSMSGSSAGRRDLGRRFSESIRLAGSSWARSS